MPVKEENKTFGEVELELLKEGLKCTYKVRFEMATRLYNTKDHGKSYYNP